jgi:hypothetical protein
MKNIPKRRWDSILNFFRSTSSKQLERKIVRLEEQLATSQALLKKRLGDIKDEISKKEQKLKKADTDQEKKKLQAEIKKLQEHEAKIPRCIGLEPTITATINRAKKALDSKEIQAGWGLFYEAELLYYHQLDPAAISGAAAKILFKRTEMLSEGDKKTVRSLIGKTDDKGNWSVKPESDLKSEDVVKARKTVQKHYEDKYTHLDMVQKQFIILGIIGALVFVLLIPSLLQVPDNSYSFTSFTASNLTATNVNATIQSSANITDAANFTATNFSATSFTAADVTATKTSTEIAGDNLFFWLTIALFGALGGIVSGINSLKAAFKSREDIPEKVLNGWVTIARPFVGLLAAVAIAVFLLSGLFTLLETTVTKYVLFAIAFASGFTERYIVGAVEKQAPSEG